MSWICDDFLTWVCFGLNQGRERESARERVRGKEREGVERGERKYIKNNNKIES